MKTIKQILVLGLVCFISFSLYSCLPYYALGNNGAVPMEFIKPVYADSALVTTHIGGRYTHTIDSAYSHKNEVNSFGQLDWSRTHILKNYNFSYGAFGYMGTYKVAKIEDFKGKKTYYGGGLSGEFCLNIPQQSGDFRIIGIKGALYYEDGNFTKFRKIAAEQNLISGVTNRHFAYNISLTSGFAFKYKSSSFGLDASMGRTHFINNESGFLTFSFNPHYTYKQYMAYVLFTKSAFGIGGEFAIGFKYRLK